MDTGHGDLYTYRPLRTTRHVRLLRISPAQEPGGKKQLACIQAFDIDKTPQYHALSYVWGDASVNDDIRMLDGQSLTLTNNLFTALPYVLEHCTEEYLWIDQLCINQADSDERGTQVALMGELFSTAESVLVWLCERIAHMRHLEWICDRWVRLEIDECFPVMRFCNMAEAWAVPYRPGPEYPPKFFDFFDTQDVCPKCGETLLSTLGGIAIDVLQCSWVGVFTRVWVLQEAVLARKARMLIGPLSLSPLQLHSMCQKVGQDNFAFELMMKIRSQDGYFEFDFQEFLTNQRVPLFSANSSRLRATDAHDYVYGILGMRPEGTPTPLTPDYSVSVPETFAQAARSFPTSQTSATSTTLELDELFGLCEGVRGSNEEPRRNEIPEITDLPSWIPDWSKQLDRQPVQYPSLGIFTADFGRQYRQDELDPWYALTVKGKCIGVVDHLLPDWTQNLKDTVMPEFLMSKSTLTLARYCSRLADFFARHGRHFDRRRMERRLLEATFTWAFRLTLSIDLEIRESIREILDLCDSYAETPMHHLTELKESNDGIDQAYDTELMHRALEDNTIPCGHGSSVKDCDTKECGTRRSAIRSTVEADGILSRDQLFLSADGKLGIAYQNVDEGDLVYIVHGHRTPMILRPKGPNNFQYVTGGYYEGAMYGEAVTWDEEEADKIVLV